MQADSPRPNPGIPRKASTAWLPVIALLVLVVGAGLYWYGRPQPEALPSPPVAAPEPAASVEAPARYPPPAPSAPATPGEPALPSLDASDDDALFALIGLIGNENVRDWLYKEHLIERIVATVDALPRAKVAQRVWPLRPVPGNFTVADADQRQVMASANAERYGLYVRAFDALDTQASVALYRRWYPLFQSAYRQLGYPRGNFHDRLIEVIDHLLAAPEATDDTAVAFDGQLWRFVDPSLESASIGHKLMLRLGSAQERTVKLKLRRFRVALTTPA